MGMGKMFGADVVAGSQNRETRGTRLIHVPPLMSFAKAVQELKGQQLAVVARTRSAVRVAARV